MSKPSIFSKDYEKIMRKRRRRFTIITIALILTGGLVTVKAVNYDYSKLRDRLQRWVDSSDTTVNNNSENTSSSLSENDSKDNQEVTTNLLEEPKEEVKEEPKEEYLDIDINGVKISFKVEEIKDSKENGDVTNNSGSADNSSQSTGTANNTDEVNNLTESTPIKEVTKKFTAVKEIPTGYVVDISTTGQKAMVLDSSQNIYSIDINGEVKNVTLAQYVAPDGEVFEKESVRSTYSGYLWHTSAKMISDTKIAYISNIPYFGNDLNQYISVVDTEKGSHIILWGSKAKNISFGEVNDKGLEVNLDGNIMYINAEGELTI